MVRLTLMLYAYAIAATILMALGVVPLLVLNMGTGQNITIAALAGAVLALPVAWIAVKAILRGQESL